LLLAGLVSEEVGVGADAFREDLIELARDGKLVLLQLRETADHEGVLEVGSDHLLEQVHVVGAKLTEALVHDTT
jgi:hypothetical protein